jgi:hypothetical protein
MVFTLHHAGQIAIKHPARGRLQSLCGITICGLVREDEGNFTSPDTVLLARFLLRIRRWCGINGFSRAGFFPVGAGHKKLN